MKYTDGQNCPICGMGTLNETTFTDTFQNKDGLDFVIDCPGFKCSKCE